MIGTVEFQDEITVLDGEHGRCELTHLVLSLRARHRVLPEIGDGTIRRPVGNVQENDGQGYFCHASP